MLVFRRLNVWWHEKNLDRECLRRISRYETVTCRAWTKLRSGELWCLYDKYWTIKLIKVAYKISSYLAENSAPAAKLQPVSAVYGTRKLRGQKVEVWLIKPQALIAGHRTVRLVINWRTTRRFVDRQAGINVMTCECCQIAMSVLWVLSSWTSKSVLFVVRGCCWSVWVMNFFLYEKTWRVLIFWTLQLTKDLPWI